VVQWSRGRGERSAVEAPRSRVTKPYFDARPVNMVPPVQVVTAGVEVDALRRMLGILSRWSRHFGQLPGVPASSFH
jgi:hypothetical protein